MAPIKGYDTWKLANPYDAEVTSHRCTCNYHILSGEESVMSAYGTYFHADCWEKWLKKEEKAGADMEDDIHTEAYFGPMGRNGEIETGSCW